MSTPFPPADPATDPAADVVSRLRAAGCVYAEDEALLLIAAAKSAADLDSMVQRRVSGLPLEQIVGWARFYGLRVAVAPGVFIPRRRTEFLVELAVDLLGQRPGSVVIDLCCGSGAVAAALLAAHERLEVYAVDIDPVAVACARRNVATVGGQVFEGDLYEPLPLSLQGRVDLLVANAPYVPTGSIGLLPAEARLYEPGIALDGGQDGLDILRRVIVGAPTWLAAGGHLLVESSEEQSAELADAIRRAGLQPRVANSAERGACVVIGTSATAPSDRTRLRDEP